MKTPLTRAALALLFAFVLLASRAAFAAPEAHVLRIDPRAGLDSGKPILSTVVEVVQFKRLSDIQGQCQEGNANAAAQCMSDKLEQSKSLFSSIAIPDGAAQLLVNINGEDTLTTFVDKVQWKDAKNQPNVGTAWLVALDASSGMGSHYADAEKVAYEFINAMQSNDLMDLMIFDDRNVIKDTKWVAFKDRNKLVEMLKSQPGTASSHGSNRALFTQIKQMTADAFGSLGNIGAPENVPMHQAMVVLSDGSGRGDAESASPSADVFHKYLDDGRLGDNTAAPKTPLPVISVLFPSASGFLGDFYKNNDTQFMMALANPEIGGFFDIVLSGGDVKGKAIVARVRERFDNMWLMHFKLSCLATSLTQSFTMTISNTNPVVLPDKSFKDVPIGIDPTQWPLNIDFDKTMKEAQANPVYPGGTFKVYGDFCWGGDKGRAESYFIPAGTKPPANANSRDPNLAKQAQQQLIAQNMRGSAIDVGDTFATFQVPDDKKILEGSGDNMVARVLIYDNKAKRASAIDAKTVLSLKASSKPMNMLLIGGIAGGVVVIILLVMIVMRGGGSKSRGAPPPPAAPPPGYGAPPPYGAPPGPGGGYQMQANNPIPAPAQAYSPAYAPPPAPAPAPAPALAYGPPPAPALFSQQPPISAAPPTPHEPPAVVQVRCPACSMTTMATPGMRSVCFSCGQPLPLDIAKGGGGGNAPAFPIDGRDGVRAHATA
jgi:hypothetical protein